MSMLWHTRDFAAANAETSLNDVDDAITLPDKRSMQSDCGGLKPATDQGSKSSSELTRLLAISRSFKVPSPSPLQ
jgi:hypothetical protein